MGALTSQMEVPARTVTPEEGSSRLSLPQPPPASLLCGSIAKRVKIRRLLSAGMPDVIAEQPRAPSSSSTAHLPQRLLRFQESQGGAQPSSESRGADRVRCFSFKPLDRQRDDQVSVSECACEQLPEREHRLSTLHEKEGNAIDDESDDKRSDDEGSSHENDAYGCAHSLNGVRLDKSQFLRLPSDSPLHVMLSTVQIGNRFLEPNEELCCEVRVFAARSMWTMTLYPEAAQAGSQWTGIIRGEACTSEHGTSCSPLHSALWHFGQEFSFEGAAVRQERRADGALHAQVFIASRPGGEPIAATAIFRVPTGKELHEPLWTRHLFAKRVGQVSVGAGWVGPEMMGWLAAEVLRRGAFGRWAWVSETLEAMETPEMKEAVAGSIDEAGRSLLSFAAMSSVSDPYAMDVLHLLLATRADVASGDAEGLRPLHYAAFAGDSKAMVALLDAGAAPEAEAAGGVTPLMLSALAGSRDCVQLLLDAGVSTLALDVRGLSALCWLCLGCLETPSRSGRHQLGNIGPEETETVVDISHGLREASDRKRSAHVPVGGSDRRVLLAGLLDPYCQAVAKSSGLPTATNTAAADKFWFPLLREAARPGPVRCGCFAELVARLSRLQGLRASVLGTVLRAAITSGLHADEQLCHMLLRDCGELPVSGRVIDGRSLVEATLDLGWEDVALMLCERGAALDADLTSQARALRSSIESGHTELTRRLVGQWAQLRDDWGRPAGASDEGLAECPVCFAPLWEGPGALFNEANARVCSHLICLACASEIEKQSMAAGAGPARCPVCRHQFRPPARRPPDPREDPAGWFAFFDESGSGYLDRDLLVRVLPAVVPIDSGSLEAALRGSLWKDWDPSNDGRISRAAFCAERGLLRWLAEHLGELQEQCSKGSPPNLEQDRDGWFKYWAGPQALDMGRAEVLRALLKSAGVSCLDGPAVAASREWIERCWLLWDRHGNGRISLEDFCADGGLADMMLQQSALASVKRVVRRLELEQQNVSAMVACFQQIVECAVGIRPEDAIESWPALACSKLRERALQPVRTDFEAELRRAAELAVQSLKRTSDSAKLFCWICRALVALSLALPDSSDADTLNSLEVAALSSIAGDHTHALDVLLGSVPRSFSSPGLMARRGAPAVAAAEAIGERLCLRVVGSLSCLLRGPVDVPLMKSHTGHVHGSSGLAPGALREAGICGLGALCALSSGADAGCHGEAEGQELFDVLLISMQPPAHPLAPQPAWLAWATAALAAIASETRLLASTLLHTMTASAELSPRSPMQMLRASQEAALRSGLSGLLEALRAGLAHRPPQKRSDELLMAVLSSLERLPTRLRYGAGSSSAQESEMSLNRVSLRDGRVAVGDVVRLHSDVPRARREQEPADHFGGWCDRMAFCLDCPGRVVEIPRRDARMPEVVRISHGALGCWCWNANAVAEVLPNAGLLPFEDGESGPGTALTIGDEVRIVPTTEVAKALQVGHGGWNDRMKHCCGKVGRLEAIDRSGDMKVIVPGVGSFVWNPRALRSPFAQGWEAALCERMAGPLEGLLPISLLAAFVACSSRMDDESLFKALQQLMQPPSGFQPGITMQACGNGDNDDSSWLQLAAAAMSLDLCPRPRTEFEVPACSFLRSVLGSDLHQHQVLKVLQVQKGAEQIDFALQLLKVWWESLPASERRTRNV